MTKPRLAIGLPLVAIVAGLLFLVEPASAARQCLDDVDELRHDIKHNEYKYTRDAREKALQALRDAELHRINPAQCYEDVAKARVALAGGRKVGNGNKDHEN